MKTEVYSTEPDNKMYSWLDHRTREDILESEKTAEIADEATEILCQCAYSWMKLFSGAESAKRCIKKAMLKKNATTAWDWKYIAWAYKAALNDDDKFFKYLDKAFNFRPGNVFAYEDQYECVDLLVHFKFYDKAIEYIDKMEPVSTTQHTQLLVIENSMGKYCKSKLRKRMEKAEHCADDEFDFLKCRFYWKRIFKDNERAKFWDKKLKEIEKNEPYNS